MCILSTILLFAVSLCLGGFGADARYVEFSFVCVEFFGVCKRFSFNNSRVYLFKGLILFLRLIVRMIFTLKEFVKITHFSL